jgi:hypothetical protein
MAPAILLSVLSARSTGIQLSTAARSSDAAIAQASPTPIASAISEEREGHQYASPATESIRLGTAAAQNAESSGKELGSCTRPGRVGSTVALPKLRFSLRGQ